MGPRDMRKPRVERRRSLCELGGRPLQEGIWRSEKAKVPNKALVTGGSKVELERPVNVRAHTYTKSQTVEHTTTRPLTGVSTEV